MSLECPIVACLITAWRCRIEGKWAGYIYWAQNLSWADTKQSSPNLGWRGVSFFAAVHNSLDRTADAEYLKSVHLFAYTVHSSSTTENRSA